VELTGRLVTRFDNDYSDDYSEAAAAAAAAAASTSALDYIITSRLFVNVLKSCWMALAVEAINSRS
jgi:hypothetical protein